MITDGKLLSDLMTGKEPINFEFNLFSSQKESKNLVNSYIKSDPHLAALAPLAFVHWLHVYKPNYTYKNKSNCSFKRIFVT